MNDVTELFLGALAIVLGGAAFAVGWQVIRDAWHGAHKRPAAQPPTTPSVDWGRPGAGAGPAPATDVRNPDRARPGSP